MSGQRTGQSSTGGAPGRRDGGAAGASPRREAPGPAAPPGGVPRTDRLAIASLVCSVLGVLAGLLSIAGIVLGFVARSRIRRSGGQRRGAGLAQAGIVVGCVSLLASVAVAAYLLHHRPAHTAAGGTSTAPHATAAGSATPSASASARAADLALARSELVPAAAFPSGWSSQGAASATSHESLFGGLSGDYLTKMVECLGVAPSAVVTDPAEATQGLYADSAGATIGSAVEVYPTAAAAETDVAAAAGSAAAGCVESLEGPAVRGGLSQGAASGETFSDPTVTARAVSPAGNLAAALEFAVPHSRGGAKDTLYLDVAFVQKDRSEAVLTFMRDGSQPPLDLVNRMVAAAAAALHAG